MMTKSIFLSIIALLFIGMTSFTLNDENSVVNENQITISLQSKDGNRVPITSRGKTIGYIEWTIKSYTPTDNGGFMTLSIYNDSNEYINVSITGKNAERCYSGGYDFKPYQRKDDVTFGCSERVSDFSFNIYVK